jgi:hypothetical protein
VLWALGGVGEDQICLAFRGKSKQTGRQIPRCDEMSLLITDLRHLFTLVVFLLTNLPRSFNLFTFPSVIGDEPGVMMGIVLWLASCCCLGIRSQDLSLASCVFT